MPTTLLLLSAVLWESMQIKLASESKSSTLSRDWQDDAVIPRYLAHWGWGIRTGLNVPSYVSRKEKLLGQRLQPKLGSAMAVGLNVASQNKDWQKDKNPCLPINGMWLKSSCCDEDISSSSIQSSGTWRSRNRNVKDREEKCYRSYLDQTQLLRHSSFLQVGETGKDNQGTLTHKQAWE